MIKRNSTEERMKLAQEVQATLLNNGSKLGGIVRSGIYADIRNPYLMKQAVLDMETLFVASGILTHEEYKLFSEQDENTGIDLTPGSVPGSTPSDGKQPPMEEPIS